MSGSNQISRRDFIKLVTGAVGGLITAGLGIPAIGYLLHPAFEEDKAGKPVTIGNLNDMPEGKPVPFSFTLTRVNGWERTASNFGGYVIVKNKANRDILVLSSRCTHLSCRVTWSEEADGYLCPCHDAKFGMHGEVIDGPPPEPLGHFDYEIDAEGFIIIIPVEVKEG